MRLRYQFVLAVLVLLGLAMAALLATGIYQTRQATIDLQQQKVETVSHLLRDSAISALVTDDPFSFQLLLDGFHKRIGIETLALSDRGGTVVAATDPMLIGSQSSELQGQKHMQWQHQALVGASGPLGQLSLLVSARPVNAILHRSWQIGLTVSLLASLAIGLFAWFLGHLLTRRLRRLTEATQTLMSADGALELPAEGRDEVAQLSRAFNAMSRHVQTAVQSLQDSEGRHRALVEEGPVAFVVVDPEHAQIIHANANATQLFQMHAEHLHGLPAEQLGPVLHEQEWQPLSASVLHRMLALGQEFRWQIHKGPTCAVQLTTVDWGGEQRLCMALEDIDEQIRIEAETQRTRQLEQLIMRQATRFVDAADDEADETVRAALEDIGRFCNGDRSYLFVLNIVGNTVSCSHEWCAEGITAQIEACQDLPIEEFGLVLEPLSLGKVAQFDPVSSISDEFAEVREHFEIQGIQSLICAPVMARNRLIGFLGLDAVRQRHQWSAEEGRLLTLFGELAISLMARQQAAQLAAENAEQTRRLNADLERSNDELRQFAYIASHDLQEPLRSITGFAQLLRRRYQGKLDSAADEYIEFIVRSGLRLQDMVRSLLEYSRVDAQRGKPVLCSLEDCLQAARENLQQAIEESGAQIEHEPLPEVFGDPPQLIAVLQNLIANALKFRSDAAPHIRIRSSRHEDRFRIEISDNGIGIPEDCRAQVFNLFRRLHTTDAYPGAGIGLSLCRRIIEGHDGRIEILHQNAPGTSFRLELPVPTPNSAAA